VVAGACVGLKVLVINVFGYRTGLAPVRGLGGWILVTRVRTVDKGGDGSAPGSCRYRRPTRMRGAPSRYRVVDSLRCNLVLVVGQGVVRVLGVRRSRSRRVLSPSAVLKTAAGGAD
jgi:hypothetical protein